MISLSTYSTHELGQILRAHDDFRTLVLRGLISVHAHRALDGPILPMSRTEQILYHVGCSVRHLLMVVIELWRTFATATFIR